MTTRQYKLYEFLKNNYADGKYISKQEICEALPEYYTFKSDTNRHNVDIEQDVRCINEWENMQKCIVSNKQGYKIGNQKECEEYFERRFKSLFKSVKSLCDMKKRLAQNGQMRLTFGKERDTIMAFMGDSDE